MAEDAGFTDAVTVLNSGNVVFTAPGTTTGAPQVAAAIRAGLLARLDLEVDVVAVSAATLAEVVAANPFPDVALSDPSHLLVTFRAEPPDAERVRAFDTSTFPERMAWAAGVSYTHYPQGVGRSRLTPAVLKRALGSEGTARSWSTVLKLHALAAARD